MITIIDYNTCNVGSIQNMLRKLGYDSVVTNNQEKIFNATKLILPGVGAFDHGINNLKELGLIPIIKEKVNSGTPILGICLGYQLLSRRSEEGKEAGLGLIEADTIKFSLENTKLKIPHMGWNNLIYNDNFKLFHGLDANARFYFVHSYFVKCDSPSIISANTEYGGMFASAIEKENIFGVQFHPEKSHKYGMKVFTNFINAK